MKTDNNGTVLYNRSELQAVFSQLQPREEYSLLHFNVKKFRYFLGRYDHETGEELLQQILKTFTKGLKKGQYLLYTGGDDFIFLIHEWRKKKIIDELIQRDYEGYELKDSRFFNKVFFSMGVCRLRDFPEADFETCCLYAWLARITSNEHEKKSSDFKFFTRKQLQEFQMRSQLEVKTVEACRKETYAVYIQPKVDAKTLKICGGEALLRWFDEDGTMIPLSLFLPVLNENSYIRYVDQMVFELVCKMIQESIQKGMKMVPISFNLSKASFEDEPFMQEYMKVFQQFDIPKEYIEFELLESISMDNSDKLIKVVDTIHKAGFRCALDDFGSGYSSLNVLQNVPVDVLKLDRFFFQDMDDRGFEVINAVIQLAKQLGMTTVAEGVESLSQVKLLQEMNCDMVQGFGFGKPQPADVFDAMRKEHPCMYSE